MKQGFEPSAHAWVDALSLGLLPLRKSTFSAEWQNTIKPTYNKKTHLIRLKTTWVGKCTLCLWHWISEEAHTDLQTLLQRKEWMPQNSHAEKHSMGAGNARLNTTLLVNGWCHLCSIVFMFMDVGGKERQIQRMRSMESQKGKLQPFLSH